MRILSGWPRFWLAGVLACVGPAHRRPRPSRPAQTWAARSGPSRSVTVHTANPTYTLDITFPDDYPDQQALTAYLTQTRDGFVNVSEMPGSWNLPYELDAKGTGYRSGPPTGGTRAWCSTMWQNVGGVHPQTWYKSFNWDIGKKAPITFDTLFKPGAKPLDVIYPVVEQYLQKQQGLIDGIPTAERRAGSGEVPELRDDRRLGDLLLRPGRAVRRSPRVLSRRRCRGRRSPRCSPTGAYSGAKP